MAKPKRRPTTKSNQQASEAQLERLANTFLDHYRARRLETAVPLAREITERYPKASFGWKALGTALMEAGDPQAAVAPLELQQLGRYDYQANMHLAGIHQQRGRHDEALDYYERSLESLPDALLAQMRKATLLVERRDYDQALAILEPLAEQRPRAVGVLTNLANLYGTMGRFDEAEALYRRAIDLQPDAWLAFSNYYFTAHYNPRHMAKDLFAIGEQWQRRYAPAGLKILGALEHLSPGQFQLYAYSDSLVDDTIARRLKALMHRWHEVPHTSHGDLAQMVRDDSIDILIDMTGHTSGSRLPVIAKEPAPLIVKWVGGLFNTTGVDAVDYLLSDTVETPDGVDDGYIEKLIRYLNDEPGLLPALSNGHLTLGCFNNPAKINEVLLDQWAQLMHALPNSRLLLKGGQYTDVDYCERLHVLMEKQGINRGRVLLEGPAPHKELVANYRRVDIALDPWPYSGGLTTCEALYMGVPVVTLPGPTFAGRHSASHLVNAGMPELVVNSWEEYRERVLGLAADLESLATIRRHLRRVLLESPVCDGPRFARHLTTALRAIWQRHCEDKPPVALSVDKEGQARFAGQSEAVQVVYAKQVEQAREGFNWQLPGKIIAIDNSAKLIREPGFDALRRLNAFGTVAFDPASRVQNLAQFESSEDVQVFPHTVLGDGEPTTLYACLDAAFSSTLEPLPLEQQHGASPQGAKVLTQLPINTIALDSIEGLESLDWLILDDLSDAMAILESGEKALKNTLAIQVRIAFQPTHERQPNLTEIQHWMARHGFRFYRFNDQQHLSHLPDSVLAEKRQATELQSADAIFLPSHDRMNELTDNQHTKLAFLLHTVYGIKDMAYALLAEVDEEKAEEYLIAERMVGTKPEPIPAPEEKAIETSEIPEVETQEFPLPDAPFMSPSERSLFKEGLKKSKHYFEFGSGGSTVWAVKEGLTVKGVESDANWVDALKDNLGGKCEVEVVDIGPTKEWGFPVSSQAADRFPEYSKAISAHTSVFDFILIDGRFRVACTMSAILHTLDHADDADQVRIFIHDFWNRPHYHVVLQFLEVLEKVDTAGLFKLSQGVNRADVLSVWEQYAKNPQ